ncbi:putative chloride channel protein [Thozetella sp. PMI_491]|nr:putative chloride channel protein [Thozetella sp. PMI_491]
MPIPRRHSSLSLLQQPYDGDIESLLDSQVSKDERALLGSYVGERLPYNDYTTIDWLHDLVKDNVRRAHVQSRLWGGIRGRAAQWWDAAQGWLAAFVIGALTAAVAFVVDVSVATVADWKEGYCETNIWLSRKACCPQDEQPCVRWRAWSDGFGPAYGAYVGFALLFGLLAATVTMTTRTNLPAVSLDLDNSWGDGDTPQYTETATGKAMYMAAGSGIPEIKTILSGFVIPHFLDFKILLVKAVGSTFAVATGMCLGKEGPFVHISTCLGYLVARLLPKYAHNQAKMREMLSVACSAGLSVAFGAPIGGVLFSYEEISTYFPRRVLWKAFLCSLVAAAALKELNPTGTGKLVLFETNYGVDYDVVHYAVFVFLGVCGGLFGGVFCKANFLWSKFFRQLPLVKRSPVLEVAIVVLATALLQYPNPLIRETGDIVMEKLLVDCKSGQGSWICEQEAGTGGRGTYYAWLISGTLVKLLLTIITFGCKVPSGVIIPALDAGALFGRMVGQVVPGISPGIFAMVGSAAFLAGVSRMTVSLAVVMFELTGEVNFIPPFMVAILTAKWVADAISADGVYDLSQHLLGHPFLDAEHALGRVRALRGAMGMATVEALMPPYETMEEITVYTGPEYKVAKSQLREKLARLKARGLMDAGLVLVNEQGICHGYLPEAELEFVLHAASQTEGEDADGRIDLLHGVVSEFIDRSPLMVVAKAPLEYAVEMFGKLGLRYMIIVEEETARVLGVVIKKRLVSYLDGLR